MRVETVVLAHHDHRPWNYRHTELTLGPGAQARWLQQAGTRGCHGWKGSHSTILSRCHCGVDALLALVQCTDSASLSLGDHHGSPEAGREQGDSEARNDLGRGQRLSEGEVPLPEEVRRLADRLVCKDEACSA